MDTHDSIKKIISEISDLFFERDHIIKASFAAILAKQHVLLLGEPGTAKSAIINEICNRIKGANYFSRLMTKFSTPEEIFGPISVKGLENDEYKRIIDGMLPTSHIATLDEIFKSNSSILNSLLGAINERTYDNGSEKINMPLISLFGASNELPQEEELEALYDRLILRFEVKRIQDGHSWKKYLHNKASKQTSVNTTTYITLDELNKARLKVNEVSVSDEVINNIYNIKMSLEQKGIHASDRRWGSTISVLKAWAWLSGSDEVAIEHLDLLCDMLWDNPSQRSVLVSEIISFINPLDFAATELYDTALDVFNKWDRNSSASTDETASKLRIAIEKLGETIKIGDPAKLEKTIEVKKQLGAMYKEVVASIDI